MRVVFHLGYPRTASTFLQTSVFPRHKEINFLGPKNYYNWDGKSQIFPEAKISEEDLDRIYNQDINLDSKDIFSLKKDFINFFDEDKINIFSNERYTWYLNALINFKDIQYLATLLGNKFKNINLDFLIVIRNQYDLIKSAYFHGFPVISKFLNIYNFDEVIECFNKDLQITHTNFPLLSFSKNYNFYLLYSDLLIKFKKANIKFLYYEDLKFDKEAFIDNFADFLNIDKSNTKKLFDDDGINALNVKKNTILFNSSWRYKFTNNSFMQKIKNYIPRPIKDTVMKYTLSKVNISSEKDQIFRQKVKEYYKESNKNFFELAKLNNKYSY